MSNIDFEEFQRDIEVAESYLKETILRKSDSKGNYYKNKNKN